MPRLSQRPTFEPSPFVTQPPVSNVTTKAPIASIWGNSVANAVNELQSLAVATTAWTDVAFQNSWSNYSNGYQHCQYRKVGDMVQMRGVMTGGTAGTIAFTLPVGFRPSSIIELPAIGGTQAINRMAIDSAGSVVAHGNPNFWIGGTFAVDEGSLVHHAD